MKSFFYKLALLAAPCIIIYLLFFLFILPRLLALRHGPNTRDQIQMSFKNASLNNYELLILGNSRIYRGINPDELPISSYNFAHDNDSFNQMFYKLKYLLDKGTQIRYLVLGVDYFQFSFVSDTRNYAYADFLDSSYLSDYEPANYKLRYYLNLAKNFKIDRLFSRTKAYLKENGQYINLSEAFVENLVRDPKVLPLQLKYFESTIDLARRNDIVIFLVMPPMLELEFQKYAPEAIVDLDALYLKQTGDSVYYLNYASKLQLEKNLYSDYTHLNEAGADAFSQELGRDIDSIRTALRTKGQTNFE